MSIRGSRPFRLIPSHRAAAAHHSRGAATLLVAALAVALGACGTVDSAPLSARTDAGGNGAIGGQGGTTGAGGVSGEIGVAGAGGNDDGAAAAAGSSASAGAGGTSSGGTDGAGNHPWTAPACPVATAGTPCLESDGGYVELTVDGGVPGSGVNSWRCDTACRNPGTTVPCATSGHIYCVASCSDCRR